MTLSVPTNGTECVYAGNFALLGYRKDLESSKTKKTENLIEWVD
jgi:ABC-type uncharacterized transport system YnjBCD substrate-binding protein